MAGALSSYHGRPPKADGPWSAIGRGLWRNAAGRVYVQGSDDNKARREAAKVIARREARRRQAGMAGKAGYLTIFTYLRDTRGR